MQIVKQVGFWLAVIAFACCTVLFVAGMSIKLVFSAPSTVKSSLENSGLYSLMARQIIQETKIQVQSITGAPVDDPKIDSAISAVVTSELVQQNLEIVIDSLYLWLQGKTDAPQFTLDLAGPKQTIAENLAEQGVARIQELPPCTPEEAIAIQDPSPFTLTCQPPIDPEGLQDQYTQEILKNEEFSAITNITAADLTTAEGQSIFIGAQNLPKTFQTTQMIVWFLLAVAAVLAIIAILLHAKTIQATKILLLSMAFSGLLAIIAGASASSMLSNLLPPSNAPEAEATQNALRIALSDIGGSVSRTILLVGGSVMIIGVAGFAAVRKGRQNEPTILQEALQPVPTHPVVGVDGRVYFVPDQPQPTQALSAYPQPLPPQTPTKPPPPQHIPTQPQISQPPPQPWQQPHPGEKKWWE